jgi:hypothetical protein
LLSPISFTIWMMRASSCSCMGITSRQQLGAETPRTLADHTACPSAFPRTCLHIAMRGPCLCLCTALLAGQCCACKMKAGHCRKSSN